MLQLPNGCSCSQPSIFPKNWKTGGASLLLKDWRIQYYFRDPSDPYMLKHKAGKLIVVKGMNAFKTLSERREATTQLLANELSLLITEGYNPIKKITITPVEIINREFLPTTRFIPALRMALARLILAKGTRVDMGCVINSVEAAAIQLGLISLPVDKVSRRHIKAILDQCSVTNKRWSNNRYNKYRAYLMMLFKELVEQEAVIANVIHDVSKKSVTTKIKTVLTVIQRIKIDEYLEKNNLRFRNFIHLFFHSGARKPELLQLKGSMVDIVAQKYRCIIKKGKHYREVERTIKTIAVPFWEYFLSGCGKDQYIFGPSFQPGAKPMGNDYPTRLWQRYVKDELGILVDFYALKHLNTSEVVDALDEKAAAALNAHTTTAMVVSIYDVKQKARQHNRLKDVGNSFV